MFQTILYVSPTGKGRPRFGKGRTFTDPKTVAAEAEIRWLLQKENPPKFEGPVGIIVRFYLKRPKSAPKDRELPCTRPDVDNYLKLVLDAANGILFDDDAQVVLATVEKIYGDPERIELWASKI